MADPYAPSTAPRFHRQGNRGFTLLELLVSMAILGMIVGVAFGTFHVAVQCYERGERIVETLQDRVYGWEQLTHQIRSAVPYTYSRGVYFKGKSRQVDFVSRYGMRWGDRRGLVRVSYRIRETREGTYLIDVYEEPLLNKKQLEERIDPDSYDTLITAHEKMAFRFFKKPQGHSKESEGKWVDAWKQSARSLPERMAVVLGNRDPDEDPSRCVILALEAGNSRRRFVGEPGKEKTKMGRRWFHPVR